jgi:hypothetical protein
LSDVGAALGHAFDRPVDVLWAMRNGYALAAGKGWLPSAHTCAV